MAGTPEMYTRTHPGTSEKVFATLKSQLVYLSEQKTALRTPYPRTTLAIILISQNAEHIVEFAEFAAQMGADRILYRPVDDASALRAYAMSYQLQSRQTASRSNL